jgi:hypothetical protein
VECISKEAEVLIAACGKCSSALLLLLLLLLLMMLLSTV